MGFLTIEKAYVRLGLNPPFDYEHLKTSVHMNRTVGEWAYRGVGSTTYFVVNILTFMSHVTVMLGHLSCRREFKLYALPILSHEREKQRLVRIIDRFSRTLGIKPCGNGVYKMYGSKLSFRLKIWNPSESFMLKPNPVSIMMPDSDFPPLRFMRYDNFKRRAQSQCDLMVVNEKVTLGQLIHRSVCQGQPDIEMDLNQLVGSLVCKPGRFAEACDYAGTHLFRMRESEANDYAWGLPHVVKLIRGEGEKTMLYSR